MVITAQGLNSNSYFKQQNLLQSCVRAETTVNRDKLWIIGVLIIAVGGFLIGLFVLSNEGFPYFSALSTYTIGFLITGLIASIFGFLFTTICLDQREKAETKADNTTKIRIMLIAVSLLYLISIGYLMSIDCEWTVRALIISSFGFYVTFTISSYSALLATLLTFGIFVLPFVINESGILDNYPDEQPDDFEMERQTVEDAEATFDRFAAFLKRRLSPVKKVKNYTLPIGASLTILGGCLVGLPHFLFIDGPWTYDPKAEIWFIKDYKGFIRGQLLLIGLLFLAVGLILVTHHMRHRRNSADKKLKPFSAKAGLKVR
jgi:MFS family permease